MDMNSLAHTSGNASIIWYSHQNTVDRLFTEK
jgi:hypothetical protein